MNNEEFESVCDKAKNIFDMKIKLAKFLRENNLEIHINKNEKGKDFIEIHYDFYEDGETIVLFSSENKKEYDMNRIVGEDLLK